MCENAYCCKIIYESTKLERVKMRETVDLTVEHPFSRVQCKHRNSTSQRREQQADNRFRENNQEIK